MRVDGISDSGSRPEVVRVTSEHAEPELYNPSVSFSVVLGPRSALVNVVALVSAFDTVVDQPFGFCSVALHRYVSNVQMLNLWIALNRSAEKGWRPTWSMLRAYVVATPATITCLQHG